MALSCSEDGYFPVLRFLCTQDVCRRDGHSGTLPEGHHSGNILLAEEPKQNSVPRLRYLWPFPTLLLSFA